MIRQLQCGPDGRFDILILSDIQEHRPLDAVSLDLIRGAVRRTRPALTVLLGDMIFGVLLHTPRGAEGVISSILGPILEEGVPFALVFGNHDIDSLVREERQLQEYLKSPLCLTPSLGGRECRQGYTLDVKKRDGGETAFSLMFLDSGATSFGRYGIGFRGPDADAVAWSEGILAKRRPLPFFIFQHVPVMSICRLIRSGDTDTGNAVRGRAVYRGRWLTLDAAADGVLGETPCPQWQDRDRQFEGWVRAGCVRAAVFGHDHKNSFEGAVDGIWILQTQCAGLHCYGTDSLRGYRTLSVFEDGSFESAAFTYDGLRDGLPPRTVSRREAAP